MASINEPDDSVRREHREGRLAVASHERPVDTFETYHIHNDMVPYGGPRLRGSGITAGFLMAVGAMLLLTVLGLAIGITAVGDPRAATDATATRLGTGAGIWAAITLLIAYFLGGMVSTKVTNHPDRGGSFIHGAVVWTLVSVFLLWLIGQGVSLGLSGFFSTLGGLTRTVANTATATASGSGDLVQRLGLTDATQIMNRLDDPQTVSVFAAATGMSSNEARTALTQFRDRIQAIRDNPENVAAEVRAFGAQYKERVEQQALKAAAAVQEGATAGSWITFGTLALTLLMSILGALAGVPSLRAWRARWALTAQH